MSIKLMSAVFELKRLRPNDKLVLLKFADHANDHGRNAFPSIGSVARACSLSARTVERAVERLRSVGVLERETDQDFGGRGRAGRGIRYRIRIERAREIYDGPKERRTTVKMTGVSKSKPPSARTETSVSEDENLRQAVADKPSVEPPEESPDSRRESSVSDGTPRADQDLKSKIFGPALEWLSNQTGRRQERLRSLLGRWVRDHGDGRVLEVITQAARCGAIEPIAWIEQTLRGEGNGRGRDRQSGLTAGETAAAGPLGLDLGGN